MVFDKIILDIPEIEDLSELEREAISQRAIAHISISSTTKRKTKELGFRNAFNELENALTPVAANLDMSYRNLFLCLTLSAITIDDEINILEKRAIRLICKNMGIHYSTNMLRETLCFFEKQGFDQRNFVTKIYYGLKDNENAKKVLFRLMIDLVTFDDKLTKSEYMLIIYLFYLDYKENKTDN